MVHGVPVTVQIAGPADVDLAHAFDGVGPLTPESARILTDRLKAEIEQFGRQAEYLGRVLDLTRRRCAWRETGYASWEEYVEKEFGISRSRAAQLISHQRFVEPLPEGSVTAVTERQTRAVRSDPQKVARVRRSVAQGVPLAEAVRRALPPKATSRTKDPATLDACEHEPVTVVVCKNCGRRLE